jgi:hypothetical protein
MHVDTRIPPWHSLQPALRQRRMCANERRRVVVCGSHFVLLFWIASSSEGLCTQCKSHHHKQIISYMGIPGYLDGTLFNMPLRAQTQGGVLSCEGHISCCVSGLHQAHKGYAHHVNCIILNNSLPIWGYPDTSVAVSATYL